MEANIREVCEILERRGMPPFEGIEWAESKGILLVALMPVPMGMRVPLPAQWAMDLITMHALRWVKTTARVELDDDGMWACCTHNDWTMHDDALGAILAATAHLEPARGKYEGKADHEAAGWQPK